MGDGIQKKFALIVNGDAESRHLGNVDRAVKALRAEGSYEISLASTKNPTGAVENFETANPEGLNKLIAGMKAKMDDDDLLVVYFTGHGDNGVQGEGCVQLPSSCVSLSTLSTDLKSLAYGKRILVMDNCYSGSGFNLFADAKTTVVSQGSPGEKVSCQLFSPYFWSDQVPDADLDGKVSVQERFQFAMEKGQSQSLLQFYSPDPISFSGPVASRPFKTPNDKPVEVANGNELKAQLARLKPGQIALVTFSADWCLPCKKYQPHFEKLAKQYEGRFLMIHAEGSKGSEEDWNEYGINIFPTVALIDWNGKVSKVMDPMDPLASLALAAVHSPEDQAKIFIAKLNSADPKERFRATLGLRAMEGKAAPAVTALTKALGDADLDVRYGAALALAEIGPAAAPAVPALIPMLESTDYFIVSAAVAALGKIGAKSAPAIPALLKWFRADLTELSQKAVAAEGLDTKINSHLVFDKEFALARSITAALIDIHPGHPDLVPTFIAVLRDPENDYPRRYHAAKGLAQMGDKAEAAVPTLISLFQEPLIGSECRDALARIAAASPATLEQIGRLAADKNLDPYRRFQFMEVLAEAGAPAVSQIPILTKIARDKSEDPRIRKEAALVMVKIDPSQEKEVAPLLQELKAVSVLFHDSPEPSAKFEAAPLVPSRWSIAPSLEFSARPQAYGGGVGVSAGYRVWNKFELRLGANMQGLHLPEAERTNDVQLGLRVEPRLHLFGAPDKSGPNLTLGEIGVYHLIKNAMTGAYLVPVGLGYTVKIGDASGLSLALKPQLHWDGEFKMGAGGHLDWVTRF